MAEEQNNQPDKKEELAEAKKQTNVFQDVIDKLLSLEETEQNIEERRRKREKLRARIRLAADISLSIIKYKRDKQLALRAEEVQTKNFNSLDMANDVSHDFLANSNSLLQSLPENLAESIKNLINSADELENDKLRMFSGENEEGEQSNEAIPLLQRIAAGVEGNFKTGEGKPQNGGSRAGDQLERKGPGVFSKVGKAIGDTIGGVIEGIGNGFAKVGNKAFKVLKGALAIAAVGVALIPAAKAFQMFSEVSWSGVTVGMIALTGLVAAVMALGSVMMSGVGTVAILAGAAALGIIGLAMIPAAKAFEMFGKALNEHVAPAFQQFAQIYGDVISYFTGGLDAVFTTLGDFGIRLTEMFDNIVVTVTTGLDSVLTSLTTSFDSISESVGEFIVVTIDALVGAFERGVTAIGNFISQISGEVKELAALDGQNMLAVGAGLVSIAGGLAAFGAGSTLGSVVGSIGKIFDKLFGENGPIGLIKELIGLGPQLAETLNPLERLGPALASITKAVGEELSSNIRDTGDAIKDMLNDVDEGLDRLNAEKLKQISGIIIARAEADTAIAKAQLAANQQAGLGSILSNVTTSNPQINNVTYNDAALIDRTLSLGSLND